MAEMTLEEALAAATVDDLPVNDILTIDAEARTIIIPASEMIFGVRQDMDAERKHFKCPKIVGDNIDLSQCHIYISYVPSNLNGTYDPNSDVGSYLCEDLAVDENYITFSWKLSGNVFAKAGYIAFAVYAKQADVDGNLKTKWHTTFAIGKVLDTLPDGEQIAEKYADVIEQLLDKMENVGKVATPEAMKGYVEEFLNENPPSGMTADEKAQLQKNTEDIGSLSEEKANQSAVNELKSDLDTYNSSNILPKNIPQKVTHGITFNCTNGVYHIYGTPDASCYIEILGGQNAIPKEFVSGGKLYISFASDTQLFLGIRYFNDDYPDGAWIAQIKSDTELTLPDVSNFSGISVRLQVPSTSDSIDMYVSPAILIHPSNDYLMRLIDDTNETVITNETKTNKISSEMNTLLPNNCIDYLSKNVQGVTYADLTFDCTNGVYHIYGTPDATRYITILGGQNIIPKCFVNGAKLYIKFSTDTPLVLGFRAFNADNPDGVWLLTTRFDTTFIVPDISIYDGIAVRLQIAKQQEGFTIDEVVEPKILNAMSNSKLTETLEGLIPNNDNPPLLTIIDDDGDKHFIIDVLPLIKKLNIPISSAVTPTRIGSASRWMNYDDIGECSDNGAEILCHTYNHHTGTEIETLDEKLITHEYRMALNILKRKGFHACDILVYSSSTGNYEKCQKSAEKVFKCGIKIGGSVVNTRESDKFALSRYRIDYAETEGRTDWNLDDMKSFIDACDKSGGWMIWMFHTSNGIYRQRVVTDESGNVVYDTSGEPTPMVDESGNAVLDVDGTYPTMGTTVYLPMLETAINYAINKGIEIVTAEYGYKTYFEN